MKTFVYYYKNLGKYNFAGTNKSWCVQLSSNYGNISELWDEDDEPDCEDLLPSQVLDLIEERLKSYWLRTNREVQRAKIADIREHIKELDTTWIEKEIESHQSKIKDLKSLLEGMK